MLTGNRTRGGFSLIELAVVIVLIGVMAAMAVPRFNGWMSVTRVDALVQEFTGDVAYARMLAVHTGRRTQLRVDAAARRYEVLRANDTGGWTLVKTTLWSTTPGLNFGPAATLEFDSRGLSSTSGITLTATQGTLSRSVQVLATGRVYRN